jgi:hypothetical protein
MEITTCRPYLQAEQEQVRGVPVYGASRYENNYVERPSALKNICREIPYDVKLSPNLKARSPTSRRREVCQWSSCLDNAYLISNLANLYIMCRFWRDNRSTAGGDGKESNLEFGDDILHGRYYPSTCRVELGRLRDFILH